MRSGEPQEDRPSAPRTLGAAIREARQLRRLTLGQVAAKADLSTSYLSQVERNRLSCSLGSLKKIARALGVPAGALMFEKSGVAAKTQVAVVRAGARKRIEFPGSRIRYEMLTPDLRRRASLLWLSAPPGAESGASAFSHEGEDAVVLLDGRLDVEVGGVWHTLSEGDAIYFSSALPHRWRNAGPKTAIAVWMSTPPSF